MLLYILKKMANTFYNCFHCNKLFETIDILTVHPFSNSEDNEENFQASANMKKKKSYVVPRYDQSVNNIT